VTVEVDDSEVRVPLDRAAVDECPAMSAVALDLHVEFPAVPIDQLTVLVRCLWAHFDGAPVREFVPLLVRKQAREELRDHVGQVTRRRLTLRG
jgi:hypothetical protein